MAAQRTTFGKIQRDRAKREKQEAKRQRKLERAEQDDAEAPAVPVGADAEGELSAAELLAAVEALHTAYENDEIDFETFEEQKAALMARISV